VVALLTAGKALTGTATRLMRNSPDQLGRPRGTGLGSREVTGSAAVAAVGGGAERTAGIIVVSPVLANSRLLFSGMPHDFLGTATEDLPRLKIDT
jgi:hypothetical protein